MSREVTHLDLFSGIGGFALAAKWAGIKTLNFCEIDPFCQQVLAKNFPSIPILGDIKEHEYIRKVDLITGGFPCQPFSQAGNKRGKNDRRYLWPEFLRVIRSCTPTWIIAENVNGIIKMELDNILTDLEKEGYEARTYVLPACAANAPHRRDRIWLIAYNNRIRSNQRLSNREGGCIQENQNRNMEEIQQKWTQLIPDTWSSFTAGDWLSYNIKSSRRNDGVSKRLDKDRIKALGNSIVPQVVYPIMKFIYDWEQNV